MNPNTALSAWQLTIMAVVPVAALAAWLTAIFLAAREPRGRAQSAAASPTGATSAGTGPAHVVPAPMTGEAEPVGPAGGRTAA